MNTITERNARMTKIAAAAVRFSLIFLLSVAMQLSACLSFASSTSETMLVTAEVKSSCSIHAGSVQFGVYDPAGTNQSSSLNVNSNISLKCVRGTTAQISIDSGAHYGKASSSSRSMGSANGDAYLAYELYQDQNQTQSWDSNSKVTQYAGTSSDMNAKIYAKIPANQNVPDGSYADILTVSVVY